MKTSNHLINVQNEQMISPLGLKELQYVTLLDALKVIRSQKNSLTTRQEAWDWLMDTKASHLFSSEVCAYENNLNIEYLRWLIRHCVTDLS